MKRIRFSIIMLILLLVIGCTSDDSNQSNSQTIINQIQTITQASTWVITNFNDSGNDETGHFRCFSFVFNPNGTITASDGTVTYNGTWSVTNSSNSSSDIDFNINFNLTNEFEDLNDDWDIVSYNSSIISLIDVSGGNGGTDLLTFEVGVPENNCTSQLLNTIQANMQSGTWRITYFEDSGVDETNNFLGYNFTFSSNGNLNANNGVNNYEGTWGITDSNNNSDSQDDLDFNINFNLTNEFMDLNDDWDFISNSSIKVELIDISGGGGGTDYLTFEKN